MLWSPGGQKSHPEPPRRSNRAGALSISGLQDIDLHRIEAIVTAQGDWLDPANLGRSNRQASNGKRLAGFLYLVWRACDKQIQTSSRRLHCHRVAGAAEPDDGQKMAPVTNIPTTIAESIFRKCRQNGDTCRLWPVPPGLACGGFPHDDGWKPRRKLPLECGSGPCGHLLPLCRRSMPLKTSLTGSMVRHRRDG